MTRKFILSLVTLASLSLAAGAHAQTIVSTGGTGVETDAANNTGSYNQAIGGSDPEYAVQDFKPTAPIAVNGTVSSLTLNLYNEGYSADAPGTVDVYLTTDTTTASGAASPLLFDTATTDTGGGLGVDINNGTTITDGFAQGSSLYFLGQEKYVTQAANTLDASTFTVSGAVATYLKNELTTGGDIRVVVAPDTTTPTVDDSWFGQSVTGATKTPPSVSFTVAAAPEPSSVVAMMIGVSALGLLVARRRFAVK